MDRWRAFVLGLLSLVSGLLVLSTYGCSAEDRASLAADAAAVDATADAAPDQSASRDGARSDVQTSDVDAAPTSYTVGGYVTGLRGQNFALSLGNEDIAIAPADGGVVPFTFTAKLSPGASYSVVVKTQPVGPLQSCAITSGSGTIGTTDVTDVEVSCETVPFSVGGNVLGLLGSGLVLKNNGGSDLPVSPIDAGSPDAVAPPVPFTFVTKVESGAPYNVTVATPPSSPSQRCDVSAGSGTIVSGDVTTVTVNCITNTFTVGGTVSGLSGSGLKLKNNGGDEITVNGTSFSFPAALKSGSPYLVSVSAQPTNPWQTCDVTSGATGAVGGENVTNVAVTCTTNTYSVGGGVSGLSGSGLKLKNNGGDEITIAGNGPFSFPAKLPSGSNYLVEVSADPTSPWQTCTVTGESGQLAGGDAKTVSISCTTRSFSVGGAVTGSVGTGLKLTNNGAGEISMSAPGPFTFATAVTSGQPYAVAFSARPAGAVCTIANASGLMAGAAVSDVAVACGLGVVAGGSSLAATQQVPPNTLLARTLTFAASTTIHTLGGYWSDSGCTVKYALYTDAAGVPGALLGSTATVTTTASTASEVALAQPVSVPAGNVWVALLSLTACSGHYAPTGGNGYFATSAAFASPFPSPVGPGAPGGPGYDVSLFARTQ